MSDDSIVVQRREIHDYVYRATRLTGADHGIALVVARKAKAAPDTDACLEELLALLERGQTPLVDLAGVPASPPPGGAGFRISQRLWARLTDCARPYLVPERRIDDFS